MIDGLQFFKQYGDYALHSFYRLSKAASSSDYSIFQFL